MIVVMKKEASQDQIADVSQRIIDFGFRPHVITGVERTVIGAIGDSQEKERLNALINVEGVERVFPVSKPYRLAARSSKEEDSVVTVDGTPIGGGTFVVMAGPCSVESRQQIVETAHSVKKSGASFLRGGAYKPRTSPYSFQGMQVEGLKLLREAKEKTGLSIVTELMSADALNDVLAYTDIIQIGARNMQNFSLLRELGKTRKPVLLKRGLSATLEELLMSAEYIMSEGNYNVMLCERGIRTYEKAYRNTLDLNAVPALKQLTHLPIIVDPSHGTGRFDLVIPMSKAAIAAGADGIIVEVHPKPQEAMSDGDQSLTFERFELLMQEIKPFVTAAGKKLVIKN